MFHNPKSTQKDLVMLPPIRLEKKKKKGIQIGREGIKLSLFADDMALFMAQTLKNLPAVQETWA